MLLENLQNFNFNVSSDPYDNFGIVLLLTILFILLIIGFFIFVQWKLFEKAGRPGWHAIVPVYNTWSLYEVVGMQGWYALLALIPFVGYFCSMVLTIISCFKLAKSFGKDTAFGFGLLFLSPIFYPIIAFSKNIVYVGPDGQPMNQGYGQPMNQNYGQPMNQNYGQPMNQNYGQPMNQGYGQPMNQNYGQPMNQGYGQPMNQNYGQPMNQNYGQPMNQNNNQQFPNNGNM